MSTSGVIRTMAILGSRSTLALGHNRAEHFIRHCSRQSADRASRTRNRRQCLLVDHTATALHVGPSSPHEALSSSESKHFLCDAPSIIHLILTLVGDVVVVELLDSLLGSLLIETSEERKVEDE